jgi:hypothetical protein
MWQANFVLARLTPLPHNAIMADEASRFSFRVEIDPLRERRYRWAIGEGFRLYRRSPQSYSTRRQAKNDALKAMSEIANHGQNKRHD